MDGSVDAIRHERHTGLQEILGLPAKHISERAYSSPSYCVAAGET